MYFIPCRLKIAQRMTTQHGIVKTFIKRIAIALVVVILLVPVYFLFSLQLTLFDTSDDVFAQEVCSKTVEPKPSGIGAGAGTEAPHRRHGDYYDPRDGKYHCPGGGGGSATSCDGDDGPGGLTKNQKPPLPSPPTVTGTIKGFAVSATKVEDISTCDKLEAYKTAGGHFLFPTEFYFELYGPYIQSDVAGATAIGMAPYSYNAVAYYPNVESPNTDYATHIYCSKNVTETSWKSGNYFSLKANDTVIINVGFLTPPLPWFQITGGGDAYANKLYSRMPLQNTLTMFF